MLLREQAIELFEKRGCSFTLGHINVNQSGYFGGKADVGREKNNGDVRLESAHASGDLSAVHAGHGEVEDDGLDGVLLKEREAGLAVHGGEDFVAGALEKELAHVETDTFIVYTEHKAVRL
jgi:hypothetical protein